MASSLIQASTLYPNAAESWLREQYVGKQIADIAAPAVILDVAVIRRNCALMLDATMKLSVGFRAHVKTHKTVQLAGLQVGDDPSQPVNLVASTLAEIENLTPWLQECQKQGRRVNVMYGIPIAPSFVPRLAAVARTLGEGTIGVFIDHPDQIVFLDRLSADEWPGKVPVVVQIDVGYHREGVAAGSKQLADIANTMARSSRVTLGGLYAHFGHSYSASSPDEALQFMSQELEGLEKGAISFLSSIEAQGQRKSDSQKILLSIGATPTATSIQNLLDDTDGARKYRSMIDRIKQTFAVEIHAGVYPVMDMQQLATRARPQYSSTDPSQSLLSFADVGIRTLVEVASVYPDRGEKPEALIAAGSIVLGREPCKSYPGWGVVTPWPAKSGHIYDPEGDRTGWIVGRISQEHGILTWEGSSQQRRELQIGEKLLLWPNHACMAGASFDWYAVVDSSSDDADEIIDVWSRCRGW